MRNPGRTVAIAILAASLGTAQAQDKLPLVKVVATGGTIANTPSGRLHAGEVAEAIPQLKQVARLEVEEVIRDHPGRHDEPDDFSASTGLPLIFVDTRSGKHIVVVYEDLSEEDLVIVRPKTAYPVREYGA